MDHWIWIAPGFLFIITVVVFFHELGHFLVARMFGTAVETFSLGFGREVIGWTDKKGTRWKLSWIPVGGYVKFLGDADASSKPDAEAVEQLSPEQRARTLQAKPLWQRTLIVAAGPFANFLLAIAIFTGLILSTDYAIAPPTIAAVQKGSPAETAGFKPGDVIQSLDGKPVSEFDSFRAEIVQGTSKRFQVVVLRAGQPVTLQATPRIEKLRGIDGETHSVGRLGLTPVIGPVSFPRAVKLATVQTWEIVSQTVAYIGKLITGRGEASQLRGPAGIADLAGRAAEQGILLLLTITAAISVSIGLLNLFPIPVLDGGHLLYYAVEAVLGRPLGERAQEVGFRLGLALVLALMLLATFNDLVRFNLF
jgi:regulator of sigma E protease